MIYRKNANFPYPVLSSTSHGYINNIFEIDVEISDDTEHYYFNLNYEIDSQFIKQLINQRKAQLIFVIQAKDNKFFRLRPHYLSVKIPKSRISLDERTSIQLHIQALEEINFRNNNDLSEFYFQFREEITVPKFSLLGYSNVIVFDGTIKRPFELFEKRVDQNLKSDIKVELGREMIIIHYRKPEFQFNHLPKSSVLNNPYVYTGLTKALQAFVSNNSEDGYIDLDELEEPPGALDLKLYNLMKMKGISELSFDNIDEVIYKISNQIIEKYTLALGEMINSGS